MAVTGPRCQDKQQPRVGGCKNLVAFPWSELDEQPRTAACMLAGGSRDLDLAVEHNQPRPLVKHVIGEELAGGEAEHDRSCRIC